VQPNRAPAQASRVVSVGPARLTGTVYGGGIRAAIKLQFKLRTEGARVRRLCSEFESEPNAEHHLLSMGQQRAGIVRHDIELSLPPASGKSLWQRSETGPGTM
jgi:hypothetical protein